MNKNEIYVNRADRVLLERGSGMSNSTAIATVLKNLESLGHTLSREVQELLTSYSSDELTAFYMETVEILRKKLGANQEFEPMYPNFPDQVMDASDAELYVNAMLHYFGDYLGVRILPDYEAEERPALLDRLELRVLGLGSEEEFHRIFQNLMSSKTSISDSDKEQLAWYLENEPSITLPDAIPHKEVLSFVAATALRLEVLEAKELARYFKTATDVLRLAAALSDGDTSLAEPSKFRSFSRLERRYLLTLLDNAGSIAEDMYRHKEMWKRLGERLHPREYQSRFPRAVDGFGAIRNNRKIERFNSRLEEYLETGDVDAAVAFLTKRPGDFARRLDHLIRLSDAPGAVIDAFAQVADRVSTPVLLQVAAHFKHRNDGADLRVVFPKGNVSKVQALTNELPAIDESFCVGAVAACEDGLVRRFAEKEALGKVFLDERLKESVVPFSQRSASKAMRTLVRGSRLDMEKGHTIRFFLWWKEGPGTGRVDIDLSAAMFDEDWNYREHISYTNLKSSKYKAAHSGDITSAPDGACEFIDLDIPSILKYGGRYVVMNVYSFTRQPFNTLPECYGGWMMRQHPGSGQAFEAATVQDKIDIASDTKICIPVILDLKHRQLIWADLALRSNPSWQNNLEGNLSSVALMGKAMESLAKPNLHDLFSLHIRARTGTLVDDMEDADTVFSMEQGVTPFDIDTIMAQYL